MNAIKNIKIVVVSILLTNLLIACAKPPVAGIKSDGKDATMNTAALPNATAAGDPPLTSASGVAIYPGSGPGPGSGSAASATDESLNDPNSLLSKRSIYYPIDMDAVPEQDKPTVQAHAEYLVAHPSRTVRLEGHTDERGSSEYNLALGQRRADGVRKILVLGGVKESQLESISYGEEKPKASTHDESSWLQNRRADLKYNAR